ncbi:glutaredoxin 3 [Porticoccaceae bacterium]|nr:glutaredoxin 3 [Porticoccaceae bacterium]MDB9970515.1 glutaredoxin 3 [Porticoccaceae bacterium]MDC0010152.1 glutaredoxin 3 [Porticoccaceae bacterium]
MSHVVLYGTRFCPFCTAARRLLTNKGIDFQDISVDNNPELRGKLITKSGRNTVPQVWFGTQHIGGFDELRDLERQGTFDAILQSEVESGETVSI